MIEPLVVGLGIAVLLLAVLVPVALAYWRGRGTRLVTCPETHAPAAVELDPAHASLGVGFGLPGWRLQSCSRWPERADCAQECLAQIEGTPDGCQVRALLAGWYWGKPCARCGKPFGDLAWQHRPALLGPDERVREWRDVPAQDLPAVLTSHRPLCWDCLIVGNLYRDHPELVVERPVH